MKLHAYQPKKARIEIVPMIDTIFFLLVFFMMASLAMTNATGMPVNLPKAASATDKPVVQTVLTLTRTGQYYVDRTQVQFAQIHDILQTKLKDNPSLVVILNCDRAQSWEGGTQLFDEAKRAGAKRYILPRSRCSSEAIENCEF